MNHHHLTRTTNIWKIQLGRWTMGLLIFLFMFTSCGSLPNYDGFLVDTKEKDFVGQPDKIIVEDAQDFYISGCDPNVGPIHGGTRVEVKGEGFMWGSKVIFGSSLGIDPIVQNNTTIFVTSPPHPPGLVDVKVERSDGKVTVLKNGFYYKTDVLVKAITPNRGPTTGGIPITVEGAGFMKDTVLIIGGHLAMDVRVLDSETLVAITPPGIAGPRDVTVVNNLGVATLKKGFVYVDGPQITSCFPSVIEINKPTEVLITGKNLAMGEVTVSHGKLVDVKDKNDEIEAKLTVDEPQPIDVFITTPGGSANLSPCLVAVRPEELTAKSFKVFAIIPNSGSSQGGYTRKIAFSGLNEMKDSGVSVAFDGKLAKVMGISYKDNIIEVVVPPYKPKVVDVSVKAKTGFATLMGGYEYLPIVVIDEVTPSKGPMAGGVQVMLAGKNLDRLVEVRIGPLPSKIIKKSFDSVLVEIGPAPPGLHDVTGITEWGELIVLKKVFLFGSEDKELIAITPNTGSIAGGTLVYVVGSGFSDGVKVYFGEKEASIVDATDPATVKIKTPPNGVGVVDVRVVWSDGTSKEKKGGFTYFDPTGYFGGMWGDPINTTVNVTVLDDYTGKPIEEAFVIIGSDIMTPYQGLTDVRGQITLSGENLFGPVTVTAARKDYSTFTFAGADAENITIFLDPILPPSSSSSGEGGEPKKQFPPGIINGKVLGIDKYILAPPQSCADRPLIHGKLCQQCDDDQDCAGEKTARCIKNNANLGSCSIACEKESDCPQGYECYGLPDGFTGCLPSRGRVEVRCATTVPSIFSSEKDNGPGGLVGEDHTYSLSSRLGDVAVYCIGGVKRWSDGLFEPVAMGIRRHVEVYPAKVTKDADVYLSIWLDKKIPVRLWNIPYGQDQANLHTLLVGIDLGSDGVIRPWTQLSAINANQFVLGYMPRKMEGPLTDAKIILYGKAISQTPDTMPYSASITYEWEPMSNVGVIEIYESTAEVKIKGNTPDVVGGCAMLGGGGIAFGQWGLTFSVDKDGVVTALPSLTSSTLYDCAVMDNGEILAVGEDGAIIRWDKDIAIHEKSNTNKVLRAIDIGEDGYAVAVGDGVALYRGEDGSWYDVSNIPEIPLNAVVVVKGKACAFGMGGVTLTILGGKAYPYLPYPTSKDLFSVVHMGDGKVLAAGAYGSVIKGDCGGPYKNIPSPTDQDILVLMRISDDGVLAGGSMGTLLRYEKGIWSKVNLSDFYGEITTLIPVSGGKIVGLTRDVAVVGPFLKIPRFLQPIRGLPWTTLTLAWDMSSLPLPSLTYTRLWGQKKSGDWTIVGRGDVQMIQLPDLKKAQGLDAIPSGSVRMHSIHILKDAFYFNNYDETDLYMYSWRSWAVVDYDFIQP